MNTTANSTGVAPLTRRDFLRATSTAVASSAVLGSLAIERAAHAAGTDELKLALIGCGGRGSGAANQALSTKGKVKLVAMADVFKDRLESSLANLKQAHPDKVEVPASNQFVGFDAYKQAIALADVVVLGTPPGFRPDQFAEAVKQGKHAFLEKPVAADAAGVRKFLAATEESKQKNLKVVVGLQRHYQPSYLEIMKRVHEGMIGEIQALRCYWNEAGVWVNKREDLEKTLGRALSEMEYQLRNWYYFVWLSGDHIVEQHVHNIDVCNWAKKAYPIRCQGMGGHEVRRGKDYGEIFDHHAVEFEYADGVRLYSFCRHIRGCWNNVTEHAIGTKYNADLSGGVIRDPRDKNKIVWRFRAEVPVDPYQAEHDLLFDAIRNDKPLNDAENGAKSTMTGIMGRMATYSGQMITWEDALNAEASLMPDKLAWDAPPKVLPDKDGLYPVAIPGKTVVA
jgi:predicted dehydrogenase